MASSSAAATMAVAVKIATTQKDQLQSMRVKKMRYRPFECVFILTWVDLMVHVYESARLIPRTLFIFIYGTVLKSRKSIITTKAKMKCLYAVVWCGVLFRSIHIIFILFWFCFILLFKQKLKRRRPLWRCC